MTANGDGFLIALGQLKKIPSSLKNFLADPSIVKFGRSIGGDAVRLKNGNLT